MKSEYDYKFDTLVSDGVALESQRRDLESLWEAGFESGRAEGDEEGYERGKEEGDTEGYKRGHEEGHDEGYSEAVDEHREQERYED